MLRIFAPAKLNLFLHITGRRADGYHLLESLVAFTAFGDTVELEPADSLSLDITGPFAGAWVNDENNLVIRAAKLLQAHAKTAQGAHIALQKNIPVGAGLGGGSADAAAALRGLKQMWRVEIDDASLRKLALQLGSDVPVCLAPQASWVAGIGEKIMSINLHAKLWAVLANPGVPLATADVYRNFSGTFSASCDKPQNINSTAALVDFLQSKRNDLEHPAKALLPVIGEVLAALRTTTGCLLARMSGSGATCFGLYNEEKEAKKAAEILRGDHPGWWCVAAQLQNA